MTDALWKKLGMTPAPSGEELDRMAEEPVGDFVPRKKTRRKKSGVDTSRPFIRGPVSCDGIAQASAVSAGALRVWLLLQFLDGMRAEVSDGLRVTHGDAEKLGVPVRTISRGLHSLESAGMVRIIRGGVGRCPVVEILDAPADKSENA